MKKPVRLSVFLPIYLFVFGACMLIAVFGDRAVTTMVASTPLQDRTCIIIDAGHGGVDGGATSCTGVLESKINLEIALRLNDLLHFLGYNTKMIRTEDISVYTQGETIAEKKISDLKQRVKFVNETENPILISIHQNTFSDSRYSGAQVFYGSAGKGIQLAEYLQNALIQTINQGSNRCCKKASDIYLLQNIDCTGILIECGFLSNPTEEARLRSSNYQQQLCCVISAALANFLSSCTSTGNP